MEKVSEEMLDAGFAVLSRSGIASDYSEADRVLLEYIYRAMQAAQASGQKPRSEACPQL